MLRTAFDSRFGRETVTHDPLDCYDAALFTRYVGNRHIAALFVNEWEWFCGHCVVVVVVDRCERVSAAEGNARS